LVLSSSFYESAKASAILDIAGARASLKLDRGNSQIHLHGGSLCGSLKTPFVRIQSGSIDASYDASGAAKTASLTLSQNQNVIQASGQSTLIGPIKLAALNVRAPCCGIKHLDVTGSYDESTENKSGHLKLDLNGEKYQLDGKLTRSNGTAEIALK
jgi:hypothetical protein